jgi:hypothetical protein
MQAENSAIDYGTQSLLAFLCINNVTRGHGIVQLENRYK